MRSRATPSPGREGFLPEPAGWTHRRHFSPHVGSVAQSALALVVVLIFVIAGKDPVLGLFTWLTNLGTLAVITPMAGVSFAVIGFFRRHADLEPGPLRSLIAPAIAGIAGDSGAHLRDRQLRCPDRQHRVPHLVPASLLAIAAVFGLIAALHRIKTHSPKLFESMDRHRD